MRRTSLYDTRAETRAVAVNSLKALADATDLEVKMLLWAAKAAHESGIKPLLTVVLETLLEMGRRDSAIVGVDLVVLIRSVVRASPCDAD